MHEQAEKYLLRLSQTKSGQITVADCSICLTFLAATTGVSRVLLGASRSLELAAVSVTVGLSAEEAFPEVVMLFAELTLLDSSEIFFSFERFSFWEAASNCSFLIACRQSTISDLFAVTSIFFHVILYTYYSPILSHVVLYTLQSNIFPFYTTHCSPKLSHVVLHTTVQYFPMLYYTHNSPTLSPRCIIQYTHNSPIFSHVVLYTLQSNTFSVYTIHPIVQKLKISITQLQRNVSIQTDRKIIKYC